MNKIHETDIQSVDPKSLVEASSVTVDINLPKHQRMESVLNQMNGNPYIFRSGKIAVKVGFADTHISLDERMEDYLRIS
jgi:hypothetical protein